MAVPTSPNHAFAVRRRLPVPPSAVYNKFSLHIKLYHVDYVLLCLHDNILYKISLVF